MYQLYIDGIVYTYYDYPEYITALKCWNNTYEER